MIGCDDHSNRDEDREDLADPPGSGYLLSGTSFACYTGIFNANYDYSTVTG